MWPLFPWKNIPPILVYWFLFRFPQIYNICKNAVFFWWRPFQTKLLFFPNNRISEAHICCQGWFRKTCTFAVLFFKNKKNKTAEKITGQCFPIKSKVTCKNLTHLEAKKKKLAYKVTYVVVCRCTYTGAFNC